MNNYKQHQVLAQQCALAIQNEFPNSRIFQRTVGLFYTKNQTPIRIGFTGQADSYVYMKTNKGMITIEIEYKTGAGRQSKEQLTWQKLVESLGGTYIIARNSKEVIAQIYEKLKEQGTTHEC